MNAGMNDGVKAQANRTLPLELEGTESGSLLRSAFAQALVIVPCGGRAPRMPPGKNKTRTTMRLQPRHRTALRLALAREL